MKLPKTNTEIERVGVQISNSFTIKSTAKSFEILSGGLYSDPIAAIVRELSCNAYDAHVAANNTNTPILIHLPNSIEPYLSIKDYGTGLCDKDVLELYTTYFESTKTESNLFTGALGLGSKTPFSYTKSYEVISRFNGTISSYHMFINEDGIPDVAKMNTLPTTEENGLEIKIGVDPKDFGTFNQRTASELKHFDVLPEVVGADHFEFRQVPSGDGVLTGDGWLIHNNSSAYKTKFTAIQGNVQYKVDLHQIRSEFTDQQWKILMEISCVLMFDIGKINFAVNREDLRYDEPTKKELVASLHNMLSDLFKITLQRCNELDITTEWDASIAYSTLSSVLFGYKYHMLQYIIPKDHPDVPVLLSSFISNDGLVGIPNTKYHTIHTYTITNNNQSGYKRKVTSKTITPSNNICVVYMDVKTRGISRMIAHADTLPHTFESFILIKQPPLHSNASNDLSNAVKQEYDLIQQELGNVTINKLSELCPPIPKTYRTVASRTLTGYSFSGISYNSRWSTIACWNSYTIDPESGGLYFVLSGGREITANYGTKHQEQVIWQATQIKQNITHLFNLINRTLPEDKKYIKHPIGLSVVAAKAIHNDPNWVDVFDLAQVAMMKMHRPIRAVVRGNKSKSFNIIDAISHPYNRTAISKLKPHSVFRQQTKTAIVDWNAVGTKKEFYEFCADLKKQIAPRNVDIVPYFLDSNFEQYPMFNLLEELPSDKDSFAEVIKYITLIDNQLCPHISKAQHTST